MACDPRAPVPGDLPPSYLFRPTGKELDEEMAGKAGRAIATVGVHRSGAGPPADRAVRAQEAFSFAPLWARTTGCGWHNAACIEHLGIGDAATTVSARSSLAPASGPARGLRRVDMTELLLSVFCGGLAAIVGVLLAWLLVLRRRNLAECSLMRRALSASTLWWWQADQHSRVRWVQVGRRQPDWLSAEPLLGRPLWQLPGTPDAEPPAALREALAAQHPFFDLPVTARATDGAAVTVWLSAEPCFDSHGRFCGYAGAARLPENASLDTASSPQLEVRLAQIETERRLERTEQSRQFELAAKEMESFSYSVSHDLRAPLRVVDGFAGIILEDYGARLDELGREHVKRIIAAAGRMNAMIDALLAMSRRTARELSIEPFDLSRATRELADELRATDFGRNVEFRIEPDIRVNGDPVLLRLVLQNLLGNAFKFSAHVPQALIEFGHHIVSGSDVYFVRDNGAGFDMRFAERLFGLFQRLHSQNDFAGTGVGLATVQRIVRKHGGRVWAESEPGKGACFYFTLPQSTH
jgi:signal transduction histidine kinase